MITPQIIIVILFLACCFILWAFIYKSIQFNRLKNHLAKEEKRKIYRLSDHILNLRNGIKSINDDIIRIAKDNEYLNRISQERFLRAEYTFKVKKLNECQELILNTNKISKIYVEKQQADSILSWIDNNTIITIDNPARQSDDLLLITQFRRITNQSICRIATYEYANYEKRILEYATQRPKQELTQKFIIKIDELRELLYLNIENTNEAFNLLKRYQERASYLYSIA